MKKIAITTIIVLIVAVLVVFVSAETYLRGDINMDGEITASDARSILRVGADLDQIDDTGKIIADVNEDGEITASDARMVLRVSAGLEDSLGTIDTADIEKTEISGGISMTIDKFMKKFGELSKIDTGSAVMMYANDYVTVVSDPSMIYEGNINSISVTGGYYMINGVYAGMDSSSAVSELKGQKWIVKEDTDSVIVLSKSGMLMKLTVADAAVTKVEYCVAMSLVSPDTTTKAPETTTQAPETTTQAPETTTQAPETTTQAPETTTQAPETTTQAPETTTKAPETTTQAPETTTQTPETTTKAPETTTKEPETTTQAPQGNSDYDKLPQQIKSFIEGEFALDGIMYDNDETPVKIYVSDKKVRIGSALETDTTTIYVDILAVEEKSGTKLYMVSDTTGKYCELDKKTMETMGIDVSQMSINFGNIDLSKIEVSTRTVVEGDQKYTVYHVKNSETAYDMYMNGDELKRIIGYDAAGNTVQMIGVDKFYTSAPAEKLSVSNYKKAWFGMLEVLGLSSLM